MEKPILVGASCASGMPILIQCLKLIREAGRGAELILSPRAGETLETETDHTMADLEKLVDKVYSPEDIGAAPASGTYPAAGMLIVPCSMKTAAGIRCGYSDNLLLRAADVTIKEGRPLVLAPRETPLSAIHLQNLLELSRIPGVRLLPPMMTFYHRPRTIEEMTYHLAAKLVEPFGIEAKEYRRWTGM